MFCVFFCMSQSGSAFSIFGGSEKDIVAYHILHFINARDAINLTLVCKTWYTACLKQKAYWNKQLERISKRLCLDTSWHHPYPSNIFEWRKGIGLKPFYETASIRLMSNCVLYSYLKCRQKIWLLERICSCYYQVPYQDISCFIFYDDFNGCTKSFTVRSRLYLPQGGIEEIGELCICLKDDNHLEIYKRGNMEKTWNALSLDQFFVSFEEWIVE